MQTQPITQITHVVMQKHVHGAAQLFKCARGGVPAAALDMVAAKEAVPNRLLRPTVSMVVVPCSTSSLRMWLCVGKVYW